MPIHPVTLHKIEDGAVYYNPLLASKYNMYIFGSSRISWIDWLGTLVFIGRADRV